jgi:hypothetical protein
MLCAFGARALARLSTVVAPGSLQTVIGAYSPRLLLAGALIFVRNSTHLSGTLLPRHTLALDADQA